MPKWLLQTAYSGHLPGKGVLKATTLSASNILNGWNKQYSTTLNKLVETVTDQPDWTTPNTPAERFGATIGDYGYRAGMFLTDRGINAAKGALHRNYNPMSPANYENLLSVVGSNTGKIEAEKVASVLQAVSPPSPDERVSCRRRGPQN